MRILTIPEAAELTREVVLGGIWNQEIGFAEVVENPNNAGCCVGAKLAMALGVAIGGPYDFMRGADEFARRMGLNRVHVLLLLRQAGAGYNPLGGAEWPRKREVVWDALKQIEKVPSLRGHKFAKCNFNGADLRGSDFEGCDFQDALLEDAILDDTNFSNCKLYNASFHRSSLMRAKFVGSDMHETDFRQTRLRRADFRHSTVDDAYFNLADLRGADFRGATAYQTIFNKAWIQTANFTDVDLSKAYITVVQPEGILYT